MSGFFSAGLFNAIPDSEGLHEWLFDEGTGTTAADRVGVADFSLPGQTWVSGVGVGDYVLDFNGVDNGATADSADLNDWGDTGSFLISVLMRDGSSDQAVFWQPGVPRLYLNTAFDTGTLEIGLADSGADQGHGLDQTDVNLNSWQGFALVWDTGNYDLHIYNFPDRTMVSGSATYSGSVSQSDVMYIGWDGNARKADMRADFPRIYDSALSQSAVKSRFDYIAGFY